MSISPLTGQHSPSGKSHHAGHDPVAFGSGILIDASKRPLDWFTLDGIMRAVMQGDESVLGAWFKLTALDRNHDHQ